MFIIIKILTILGKIFNQNSDDFEIYLYTNFDLFFGVFAKIIAKKNKYYG